jgi:tRNA nucleotidyltransferase (CCA-adding enzyme)
VSDSGSGALENADARRVLDGLDALPGGPELLELAAQREDVALVGGASRDLLLGRVPRELDVVLASGASDFAAELAELLGADAEGATVTIHDRFGTAAVDWRGGRVDIAERRAEAYPSPGALPEVREGTVEEDLARRDFTVNAIAAPLGGALRGTLQAAAHALDDLLARRLRVLHEGSFRDDPTRLLRLARYGPRLGFGTEDRTARLADEAIAGRALDTVSRARVGAELRLALTEDDPLPALGAMDELGLLAALDSQLRFDSELARRALSLLPPDGRADLMLLAELLLALAQEGAMQERERAMFDFLDPLEFNAPDRERAIKTALAAPVLVTALRAGGPPSGLHDALASRTLEAVALAGALGGENPSDGTAEAARRWLQTLRHVGLSITGQDLLDAGVPEGPQVGRRLTAALHRKLDGELADGREAELRAALQAPP